MNLDTVARSPTLIRLVPFVVFVAPIYLQGALGSTSPFWIYAGRTLLGAALLCWMWPRVQELRWAFSPEAVLVGIGVFVIWVGLDPFCPTLGEILNKIGLGSAMPDTRGPESGWNPFRVMGENSLAAWALVVIRIVGSSLVVPPLEEVFYRSFLYRYVVRADFNSVPMRQFDLRAMVLTCLVFGFAHQEWLAGILCAAAYQGLVLRRGRLGDAMLAHAITNFLLGLWVVGRGQWQFW